MDFRKDKTLYVPSKKTTVLIPNGRFVRWPAGGAAEPADKTKHFLRPRQQNTRTATRQEGIVFC